MIWGGSRVDIGKVARMNSSARNWGVWLIAVIGLFAFDSLRADDWSRTITLKIASDSAHRKRPDWMSEIQKTVGEVSAIWERQFGIRWKVVGFADWEPPMDDSSLNTYKLLAHLRSNIPLDKADVVVGIFEGKCLDQYSGASSFFGASAIVSTGCLRKGDPRNTVDRVLSHELAHLFGAFHVRPHIRSVMSGDGPDIFDPQTREMILLMRDREFKKVAEAIPDLTPDKQAAINAIFAKGHQKGTRNPAAMAYLVSGLSLLAGQKYEEAVQAFNKASEIEINWAPPHLSMGAAYEKLGKLDLATAAYQTALSKDGSDVHASEFLARLKALQGDKSGAVAVLNSALQLNPRSARLRNGLGTIYMAQGKAKEAEAEFREVLRLDPDTPNVRGNLGVALGRLGKYEESAHILREAIRLNPNDDTVQGNLGYVLELMGDTKGALETYRKVQAMNPANRLNQINLERLLKRMEINKGDSPS